MRYSTILVLGLLTAAAGCDLFNNALEVQSPSSVPASGLETPANAQLLANGAIADFECAAGSYAVMGGLITDELLDATQTADRFPYDRRTMTSSDGRYAVNDCIGLGVYTPLQTARFSALNVISLLQGWTDAQVPGRDTLIVTLQAYEGYSLVYLGEGHQQPPQQPRMAAKQRHQHGDLPRRPLHQHDRPASRVCIHRRLERNEGAPVHPTQVPPGLEHDTPRLQGRGQALDRRGEP